MVLCLILCALAAANAQKPSILSGDEILSRIEANFSGIEDYTVDLDVAVDLDRLKVPRMRATMYFKSPDKTRFVSEGFALLPKEGLGFTPGSLRSRFTVEDIRPDSAGVKLMVAPRNDRTRLRKIFLTVDTTRWTVHAMAVPQFDGRRMDAQFDYRRTQGHWLPERLQVTFRADTTEHDPPDPFGQFPTNPRPSQIPRQGTITVRYEEYKLNSGLKNELFEQEKPPQD